MFLYCKYFIEIKLVKNIKKIGEDCIFLKFNNNIIT